LQEAAHLDLVAQKREVERLKLKDNLEPLPGRMLAELTAALHPPPPLILGRNHLLLPDVLPDHEEVVFCSQLLSHIQVAPGALEVELSHARVEIYQTDAHAHHGHDGQLELAVGLADPVDPGASVRVDGIVK